MLELVTWLYKNNPKVFKPEYILQHSEISGMKGIGQWRKVDYGGCSKYMAKDIREMIKQLI